MTAINPLAQVLAQVVEPWTDAPGTDGEGSLTVVATSGTVVDLNMRRPVEHEADHLYVWPIVHTHATEGAGNPPEDREDFQLQLLYVVERGEEEPAMQARRDVSDALDARAELYAERVAANRVKYPTWQHAYVSTVQHDTVVTFGARGIGLVVSGYRYS